MRKSVTAVALTVLLVFAATAFAGTARFKGGGTSETVSFKGHGPVNNHGDVVLDKGRVTDFSIENVTQKIDCGTPTPEKRKVGYFFEKPIDIEHGVFFESEKVDQAPDQTARVKGHFEGGASTGSTSAEGWFRLSGKSGPCSVETGRVQWTAHITR